MFHTGPLTVTEPLISSLAFVLTSEHQVTNSLGTLEPPPPAPSFVLLAEIFLY